MRVYHCNGIHSFRTRDQIIDGCVDLGDHPDRASAVAYARDVAGIDCDDDGYQHDDDGAIIGWLDQATSEQEFLGC